MKKSVLFFLILLFGALCLISCKSHNKEEKGNPVAPSGLDATPVVTASPIPSPTVTPLPTATPSPTPTPVSVLADRLEATEDTAVFKVSTFDLTCYDMNVYRIQNKMVYFYNENSTSAPKIISYDIATGEKKERVFEEIDPFDYDFEVVNDEFIVVSNEKKVLHYLDADLNTMYTLTVPLDSLDPCYAVSKDYSKIYYIKENCLYVCEPATGTETLIRKDSLFMDASPSSVTTDGRYICIYAYSRATGQYETQMYNLESGEVTLIYDIDGYTKYYISPDKKEAVIRNFRDMIFKLYRFDEGVPEDFLSMLDSGDLKTLTKD